MHLIEYITLEQAFERCQLFLRDGEYLDKNEAWQLVAQEQDKWSGLIFVHKDVYDDLLLGLLDRRDPRNRLEPGGVVSVVEWAEHGF